jgi:hypothetical protein
MPPLTGFTLVPPPPKGFWAFMDALFTLSLILLFMWVLNSCFR